MRGLFVVFMAVASYVILYYIIKFAVKNAISEVSFDMRIGGNLEREEKSCGKCGKKYNGGYTSCPQCGHRE